MITTAASVSLVMWCCGSLRLVWASGKAVAVSTTDSAAAAPAAPVALVVQQRPIGGKQQAATLAARIIAAVEESPAVDGRCCRCSALGNDKRRLGQSLAGAPDGRL